LGAPNSIGVTTWLVAAPLGTGIGSGYGTDAAAHSFVRHNRSMRYDSPSFEGFTVSLNYAPGNDRTSGEYPGFVANATRTIPEVSGAHLSPRAPEVRELGANYAAGPFNLAIAHIVLPGQNIDGTAGADATKEISHTLLSGRFTTGATQLSGGWHQGDLMQNLRTDPSADGLRAQFTGAAPRKVNTTNFKVEGFRLGIQHDIGAVSLRGKYTESSISNSDDSELKAYNTTKRSLSWTTFGFRADYNFSKRSAVYFGFEQWRLPTEISKLNTLPAGTPANENARVLTSVGMRHSF
jgi:predicted porin